MGKLPGALIDGVHDRLFGEINRLADHAGISKKYIIEPTGKYCDERIIKWMRTYTGLSKKRGGLLLTRRKPPLKVMGSITGTFVRSFVNAGMIPANKLAEQSDPLAWSVLVLPDFCYVPNWMADSVASLVMSRLHHDRPTVIWAPSPVEISNVYSPSLRDLITEEFIWFKLEEPA